ncbi:MAG TPA: DUF4232 domain-containing protein [Streptosporangiaceae bacterium]|nr:DUF4232 domain-containing protein [Streptosporangiaceae bacterium]
MSITAPGARRLAAVAALASSAAFVTACGSSPGPASPAKSVTITVTQTASPTQPTPSPSSSTPATPNGPAECTSADLKVNLGSSNGAAGTIYYNIDFTNTSSGSCFVQGYPGVSLVSAGDGSGAQIGADAKRAPVAPSHQIVLAPGQTANAALGVAEAGNFPASKCNETTAHWLKVFPPDQTVAAYVAFTTQTCSSNSVATMRISAITSGP